MAADKVYNWYGRLYDGTESESDRVLNDQNVHEYEFFNASVGWAVRINGGIVLPPGGVFRERFDSESKTGGEYRFEWVDWVGKGSFFSETGAPGKYQLFSVREKRPVGKQDKNFHDA